MRKIILTGLKTSSDEADKTADGIYCAPISATATPILMSTGAQNIYATFSHIYRSPYYQSGFYHKNLELANKKNAFLTIA
jgi:hypothetical protein